MNQLSADKKLANYLRKVDPNELSWVLYDDGTLEVLIDFYIWLHEAEAWSAIESAFLESGGKVVTENDKDFDLSNWGMEDEDDWETSMILQKNEKTANGILILLVKKCLSCLNKPIK